MQIPILYENKEDCCGCTACFATCPVNAIEMISDDEGFLYPVICEDKCVQCQKCLIVCPVKKGMNQMIE